MFPLSHTFISTQVTGRQSDLLVFGSVLPDIATTSKGEIGRDKIHYSPNEFYDYVSNNFPELFDLAIGVKLHSNIGRGADFYSDDAITGYAKVEGKKISEEVAKLLEVADGPISLGLAHNFIEIGLDFNLKESQTEIFDIYKIGLENADTDLIGDCLTKYLQRDRTEISAELENFKKFLSPDHLISLESVVRGIVIPLTEIRFNKSVDFDLALKIAIEAIEITLPTYQEFFQKTLSAMRLDFTEFASK